MAAKKVLLLIAGKGYQPLEYGHTREELEAAGCKVVVASTAAPIAYAVQPEGPYAKVSVDLLVDNVQPELYDAIIIIGGPGALECLDTPIVYDIMRDAQLGHKVYGAICVSPRILAHAGLLARKKATGWDGDGALQSLFSQYKVLYQKEPVVVDGSLVTAEGPTAARAFGQAIAKCLSSKER